MVMTSIWTATRTDRGLSAAHGGTALASRTCLATTKPNGIGTLVPFVAVPAYVADQESYPPRGNSA
jgi:hypothetical protein